MAGISNVSITSKVKVWTSINLNRLDTILNLTDENETARVRLIVFTMAHKGPRSRKLTTIKTLLWGFY